MNTNEIELSKLCWNKYEQIHSEKIEYFRKLYIIFEQLNNYLLEFQKNYDSLEIDALINPIVDDQFNELIKAINKNMKNFFDLNSVMLKSILKEFIEINNKIKEENTIYEKVISDLKKYKEKKEKMEKIKNHFNEKMEVIEDSLKEKVIQKNNKSSVDNKKLSQAMKDFNEYKQNLDDYNKIREGYNKNQKTLLDDIYKEIFKREVKLFDVIKTKFSIAQKNNYDFSLEIIEKYKSKKESKKEKSEKEFKYFNNLINHYKSEELAEEKLGRLEYHLKHKPFISDPNCTPEDLMKANTLNEDLLKLFRKTIKDNYPDSGLQIQEAILQIPDAFNKFFGLKQEVTEELKEEMLKLLKEDISLYRQILIIMGKLRADGKLYSSKEHIEFITTLLLEILKLAEQKLDYKSAKDCILLSQTYYIINDKNEKIYSFEKVKHNTWIKSSKFWRDFLDSYINIEFKKFEEMYNLSEKLKDNPKFKDKMMTKIKEMFFSCLVPYVNNMRELNLDKRIILKLIDEILEKYKYLDEISINNLESFISNSSEEIQQLREEYKSNPDLENELEKENEKEKNNEKLDDVNKTEGISKNEINEGKNNE